MQAKHTNSRLSVRKQMTDNHPTPRLQPENGLQALIALMARANLYKLGTNALALAFVAFYAVDFVNVAANGNHLYTIYRLFPVLAATAIAVAMGTLPENSLTRLFYLAGMFTVSWLV